MKERHNRNSNSNIIKALVMLALIGILFAMFTINVEASEEPGKTAPTSATTPQTITREIELTTRSALLVDRSGSMEDIENVNEYLAKFDTSKYDFVGYFDHRQISVDPDFEGGGDSYICEAIDKMAERGFIHIDVITDGQQWPQEYDALVGYTDIDLTIYLVEETEDSEELTKKLAERMVNSSLQVVTPDGDKRVILDDYQPPVYTIEIPLPEEKDDEGGAVENIPQEQDEKDTDNPEVKIPWWWFVITFLLAVLIAALFDLIHELITHRDRDGQKNDDDGGAQQPLPVIPEKGKKAIAEGDFILADISGSMATCQQATAQACQSVNGAAPKCIAFGQSVMHVKTAELSSIPNQGQTYGWEAVETAWNMGKKRIVIVSDMQFNGKAFQAGQMMFERITVIAPAGYKEQNVEQLRQIAKEVEVLPLQ